MSAPDKLRAWPEGSGPSIAVLSTLFPHARQPNAGLFVRERMFRVAEHLPLLVIMPQPWFPGQALIRRFRPGYRPPAARCEVQSGIRVIAPRFFAVPGVLRGLDGTMIAWSAWWALRRLRRTFVPDVIDAHFAYPSGYAATLLGRWLGRPVTITMRGTEPGHLRDDRLGPRVVRALAQATRVFAVSESLKRVACDAGIAEDKVRVVGNGVDTTRFTPIPRSQARERLRIPSTAKVLITVGGLVERKGFHRVIDCLPALIERFGDVRYLVVGGASPEGDMGAALRAQTARLGLQDYVIFTGPVEPAKLRVPLSAADVFVLSTRNEGWANVLLEAMACGLPVVTTDVGGNREVVRDDLGIVVPFGDEHALETAIGAALQREWDAGALVDYARANGWDARVRVLVEEFRAIAAGASAPRPVAGAVVAR